MPTRSLTHKRRCVARTLIAADRAAYRCNAHPALARKRVSSLLSRMRPRPDSGISYCLNLACYLAVAVLLLFGPSMLIH